MPTRIAMWSGPRNISTAMMRSWDARPDTVVCDEPLYARYLYKTGAEHPGHQEIIQAGETNLDTLIANLTGSFSDAPCATGCSPAPTIHYQKHMAHHLFPSDDLDWIDQLTSCLLIRDPAEMITSYIEIIADASPEALGLPQQLSLLDRIIEKRGTPPPILDARDVLEQPAAMLRKLCDACNVPYTDAMLSWEPGPRPTDGVWAKHWYANVERSTGFAPYKPKNRPVPEDLLGTLEACNKAYLQLHELRIHPG